jgi:hypothetical protein
MLFSDGVVFVGLFVFGSASTVVCSTSDSALGSSVGFVFAGLFVFFFGEGCGSSA